MTTSFHADAEFNDQIQRSVTAAARGGADFGEVLAVAERITPGDFDSWHREWEAAAEKARGEADASLTHGDLVSARRAYLRSSEYYRQATFFLRGDLTGLVLQSAYRDHRETFRAAADLLPHHVREVTISHHDVEVRGYLFCPAARTSRRATVLAPAGDDSTAESGYTLVAQQALERGLNCLVFEGPGQGGVLLELGLPLRHDFEHVLTPVVDWLLAQPEVDPDRLVLLGRGFAGYLAPRGATAEHRLAALICDPAQYDVAARVRAQVGAGVWDQVLADDPAVDAALAPLATTDHQRNAYGWRMAAHGVTTLRAYFRELSKFSLVGLADRISCPTLVLSGEGDPAGTGQLRAFAEALTVPVSTHEFTHREGAGGHCEGLGQDRFDQLVHGWIAGTLRHSSLGPTIAQRAVAQ